MENRKDALNRANKLEAEIKSIDRQLLDLQHKKFKLQRKLETQRRIIFKKAGN